jgi:hypothetical protein
MSINAQFLLYLLVMGLTTIPWVIQWWRER